MKNRCIARFRSYLSAAGLLAVVLALGALNLSAAGHWVGTWTTAQMSEPAAKESAHLTDATIRQIIHVSIGGDEIRVRFSNAFGRTPLEFSSAHIALSAGGAKIETSSDHEITFAGKTSVSVPPGAVILSDPLKFKLPPLANVAITMHIDRNPKIITLHPGSRETSFYQDGYETTAADLANASKVDHWYYIDAVDVMAPKASAAIAILGDSITDGHATTTNKNTRWTDDLARRLQANGSTSDVGVLNLGIGGNRLLRDGLGPNALARFNRDILAQSGVRWLIVLEGINDIGTRLSAKAHGWPYASADDIINALQQIVWRAHAQGIKVIGGTIMPYKGANFYWSPDGEAAREKVNHWIRTSGAFDAVIDFDAITRDPKAPEHLNPSIDSGDHLHPGDAGYQTMADGIDLNLFKK